MVIDLEKLRILLIRKSLRQVLAIPTSRCGTANGRSTPWSRPTWALAQKENTIDWGSEVDGSIFLPTYYVGVGCFLSHSLQLNDFKWL